MRNFNFSKKLICGVIAGSLMISGGLMAFADNEATGTDTQSTNARQGKFFNNKGDFQKNIKIQQAANLKSVLDALVEEGKFSAEKSAAVQKYIQTKMEERKSLSKDQLKAQAKSERVSLFDAMVNDGVLTKEDVTLIKEKQRALREEKRVNSMNSLVQKGVITQVQLDKINSYMKTACEEKQQLMEKLKGMTAEERKAYFQNNKVERKNFMQKLIDDGVITQEQAKEIRKAMPGMHGKHFDGKHQGKPKHEKQ